MRLHNFRIGRTRSAQNSAAASITGNLIIQEYGRHSAQHAKLLRAVVLIGAESGMMESVSGQLHAD